jgi:hypothetical protein
MVQELFPPDCGLLLKAAGGEEKVVSRRLNPRLVLTGMDTV